MKGLTDREISGWLQSHGLIEDPYLRGREPAYRVVGRASGIYARMEGFLEVICDQLMSEGDLLIHITDSFSPRESRNYIASAVRQKAGELRSIEDAPGMLVNRSEVDHAVAQFALCCCFGWKSYLYGTRDRMTLYNWEGEIFDFWTDSEQKRDEFRRIMKNFELEEVPDNETPEE